MKQKNLLYNSNSYYEENDYYELFSTKEDSDNKVIEYFNSLDKYDVILDAGCGTGKYTKVLENISNKYIGIDLSNYQIAIAKRKRTKNNSEFINTNLVSIPLPDNTVDLVVSCWVLGTITNLSERLKALSELNRVLKPNGKLILIENDDVGEFEIIRNHNIDGKTKVYNDWLKANGLNIIKKIDTRFVFNDIFETNKCIENIYGKKIASKIKSNIIEHKIVIFSN